MLTAVAREQNVITGGVMIAFCYQRVFNFRFVFTLRLPMSSLCYIYITNHLLTGPTGNS